MLDTSVQENNAEHNEEEIVGITPFQDILKEEGPDPSTALESQQIPAEAKPDPDQMPIPGELQPYIKSRERFLLAPAGDYTEEARTKANGQALQRLHELADYMKRTAAMGNPLTTDQIRGALIAARIPITQIEIAKAASDLIDGWAASEKSNPGPLTPNARPIAAMPTRSQTQQPASPAL